MTNSTNNRYGSITGSEYDLTDLGGLVRQVHAEAREDQGLVRLRYGHLKHDVLGAAIEAFEEATGHELPWNLNKVDMWPGIEEFDENSDFHPREQVAKLVHRLHQTAGWLRSSIELPGVRKIICKSHRAGRGMGSPYVRVYLYDFVEKNPSPGKLERRIWKVRRRANEILSAWEGRPQVAWAAIARALIVTRAIGKAAVIAAAETLASDNWSGPYEKKFFSYAAARDFLTGIRSTRFTGEGSCDEGSYRMDPEAALAQDGYEVHRVRLTDRFGRIDLRWRISHHGREFVGYWDHCDPEYALDEATERYNDWEEDQSAA